MAWVVSSSNQENITEDIGRMENTRVAGITTIKITNNKLGFGPMVL